MQDIIKFTPTAENTGDQTGLEFEFEWKASDDPSVRGNYAYQDPEDEDTKSDALQRPASSNSHLRAGLPINLRLSQTQLNYKKIAPVRLGIYAQMRMTTPQC